MAQEPNEPRRLPWAKSPPPTDPYCLFSNDRERRFALGFREACRLCGVLAVVGAAMYLHLDHGVLLSGGALGLVYKFFWR